MPVFGGKPVSVGAIHAISELFPPFFDEIEAKTDRKPRGIDGETRGIDGRLRGAPGQKGWRLLVEDGLSGAVGVVDVGSDGVARLTSLVRDRFCPRGGAFPAPSREVVSVVSLNIWNFNGDWAARAEAMTPVLARHDVILLQEVRFDDRYPEPSQMSLLVSLLSRGGGGEYSYVSAPVTLYGFERGRSEEGLAVLVRRPLTLVDFRMSMLARDVNDEDGAHHQRGALVARVQAGRRVLDVIVTHLGLAPASRAMQGVGLAWLASLSPGPTVIAGDMNEDMGVAVKMLLGEGFLDPFAEGGRPTFPTSSPIKRIDYMLHKGPVKASAARLVADEWAGKGQNFPSDHLGLSVTYEFK